jgi:hypothetical protein
MWTDCDIGMFLVYGAVLVAIVSIGLAWLRKPQRVEESSFYYYTDVLKQTFGPELATELKVVGPCRIFCFKEHALTNFCQSTVLSSHKITRLHHVSRTRNVSSPNPPHSLFTHVASSFDNCSPSMVALARRSIAELDSTGAIGYRLFVLNEDRVAVQPEDNRIIMFVGNYGPHVVCGDATVRSQVIWVGRAVHRTSLSATQETQTDQQ